MKTGKLIFALVFLMLFADASMAAKWKAKHVVLIGLGGGGNVLSLCEQAEKALLFRLFACGLSGPSAVSQSAAPPFWR